MYNKVYVEITNICNMNCSFCHGHNRALRQMSEDEFKHILASIKGQTEYVYYHLMGEPLTHPLLPRFLELAKCGGFKSIITTNGTLLKKRGEKLLSAGLHKVNISLHSFEGDDEVSFKKYVDELSAFALRAAERGVIIVFRLWNKGFDLGKNETAISLLKENISGDLLENTRGFKLKDKIFIEMGDRFLWPDKDADVKGERFFCYGLRDQFGILSDGTVVPCCLDSDGVINLGNIFREDIKDILNSKRATDIYDNFKCGKAAEELCKRCGYAQRFVK